MGHLVDGGGGDNRLGCYGSYLIRLWVLLCGGVGWLQRWWV